MPHGHCYLWKPALVSAHVGSDLLIGLAYISISLILYALAKRIKLQFSAVVLCFGVFIGACGLTHFMEIWTLWQPDYWASAWIKGVTAVASVGTGVYLYRLRSPIVNVVEALRTAEARRIKLEESTFDLVDRENTLRSFFEAAPMMLGIADLENDDIRHVSDNPTAVEFFGRSADETKGRLASELGVPPASIQLWVEHYRRAEETNAPVRFEYSHETPNGDRVLAVVVSLIGKSPHGYSRFSYIVQDITEQRKAEADLRDSKTRLERLVAVRTSELRSAESRFKSTFDRAAIGIVHTDLKGRFMMVNPKMCEITGYSEDELLTKSFDDITHPDDHELNWKGVEALVNGELSTFEYEKRYLRKNGSVIWVKVSAAVSRDFDGKPEYFITCIDDITEKKTRKRRTRSSLRTPKPPLVHPR